MTKRILALVIAVCFLLAACPVAMASDGFSYAYEQQGNTGAMITITEGQAESVSVDDSELAAVTVEGNTITVIGMTDAVGVCVVTITYDGGTQEIAVPIGYTTFLFDGDRLTVVPGSDDNYEVAGINALDEEYLQDDPDYPLPVTENADGSMTYQNAENYKLCVNIKKSGGTYVFNGKSEDMTIAVKKEATAPAVLLLTGLELSSSFTSPITIKKNSTSTVAITALAGHTNVLKDAEFNNADLYGSAEDGGDETNVEYAESAVIKGKDYADVTLNGSGTLKLECVTKNAVKVNEYGKLTIDGLNLIVESAKHGISSDNTLQICSGVVDVTAASDGIRTDPDTVDSSIGCAGNIEIFGGHITVRSGADCIQAAQDLNITGGVFDLTAGAGYDDPDFDKDTMSCKGLKASFSTDDTTEETVTPTNLLSISSGMFTINTADDSIHSDGSIEITGGIYEIMSGDDAVHADADLTLGEENGEDGAIRMNISACYEGLEGAQVYLYSGIYNVIASDDGVNAAGDSTSTDAGDQGNWPGMNQGGTSSSSIYHINIYGGVITVSAGGDGLDANGNLNLYGGKIVVWATVQPDVAMDCDGTLTIDGAEVFAAGPGGMIVRPSSASQSYVSSSNVRASQGDTINVKYNNETIYNVLAEKSVSYVLYSSPDMTSSSGYSITVDNADLITEEVTDICAAYGHAWNGGTVCVPPTCTEEGEVVYTCMDCGETKNGTLPVVGHAYEYGYCSGCGAEDPDASWYTVTFDVSAHCSITVYHTQDVTGEGEESAQSAIARNSDTGKKDMSGNGQVNFIITVAEGYQITELTVTEGTGHYKNLKVIDAVNGIYRITKITGDLTLQVTAEEYETYTYVLGQDGKMTAYLDYQNSKVAAGEYVLIAGFYNVSGKLNDACVAAAVLDEEASGAVELMCPEMFEYCTVFLLDNTYTPVCEQKMLAVAE